MFIQRGFDFWKDTRSMSIDSQRPRRFIGGVILLFLAGIPLTAISVEALGIPGPVAVATFLVYLLIQAALMSWLVGILFQQHEMRKFKIGIGAMMVLTTMIALPLGAASVYRQMSEPIPVPLAAEQDASTTPQTAARNEFAGVMFAIIMYFALLPLLMVTEAILVWYLAYRTRQHAHALRK